MSFRFHALPLVLVCLLPLGCSSRDDRTASAPATQPAAAVQEVFPYPLIELSGDGAEIGAEHGRHFGAPIRRLHDLYFGRYFRNDMQRMLALSAATAFESHLSSGHREEVHSLARESGVAQKQMMLAQCFLDLSAMTACSTVTLPAEASPDGVARFGRNLDFPSFDIAHKYTAVFAYRPAGRYAFVSVGWPGLIGVLSGMNEHGLSIANMEVSRPLRLPEAMPYTLLYRTILEECRTTQEAIDLLNRTPRQSANNLMVMDAAGDRAVIEITPSKVTVRRGMAWAALFSTNHQRDQDCDSSGRCHRYDTMHELAEEEFGTIDAAKLQSMLNAASQRKLTLQSMIFEPANRVVLLSAGENAAAGEFHCLDLKEFFAGGPLPAAKSELPPLPSDGVSSLPTQRRPGQLSIQ